MSRKEATKKEGAQGGTLGSPLLGTVAIVGFPNVGKSTLVNRLTESRAAVVHETPGVTRDRKELVCEWNGKRFLLIDTGGVDIAGKDPITRSIAEQAKAAVADADLVLFLTDARAGITPGDEELAQILRAAHKPVLLVANKLDTVHRRAELAPWLQSMQERHPFAEFVPMSATKDADVKRLFAIIEPYLPEQGWFYDEEALTDRSERFLASELIREKLFRLTGDELPYSSTVVIDKFEEEGNLRRIAATIIVERDAHKGMIIGSGGERLKRIGSESRQELETLLGAKVFLELWVKVRSGWADSEEHLRSYGYE